MRDNEKNQIAPNVIGLGEVCEALACVVGQIAPNPCYVSVIFFKLFVRWQ